MVWIRPETGDSRWSGEERQATVDGLLDCWHSQTATVLTAKHWGTSKTMGGTHMEFNAIIN